MHQKLDKLLGDNSKNNAAATIEDIDRLVNKSRSMMSTQRKPPPMIRMVTESEQDKFSRPKPYLHSSGNAAAFAQALNDARPGDL